jgi:hypothetical protein
MRAVASIGAAAGIPATKAMLRNSSGPIHVADCSVQDCTPSVEQRPGLESGLVWSASESLNSRMVEGPIAYMTPRDEFLFIEGLIGQDFTRTFRRVIPAYRQELWPSDWAKDLIAYVERQGRRA